LGSLPFVRLRLSRLPIEEYQVLRGDMRFLELLDIGRTKLEEGPNELDPRALINVLSGERRP
jgi:hypothetical protein